MDVPLIRLERIEKSFGSVRANKDITLDIHAGRIKALLGENGAGKSTLMSILAGRYQPDAGRILVDGRPVRLAGARQSLAAGIGMVHQHFMLVESLTVAENIFLGLPGRRLLWPAAMREHAAALSARYGLGLDPARRVAELSMGEKQRVEILKLLARDCRVLIFDEPTAVLTPGEAAQLFEAFRGMKAEGKAVVFISHKLQEVMDAADEIAILRRGAVVDAMRLDAGLKPSKADLATRMVGKEVMLSVRHFSCELGDEVLSLEGLTGESLKGLDLTVRKGEIVCVAGVAGNGQKELVEVVCGLARPGGGRVRLMGRDWEDFYPAPPRDQALAYVPEDRQGLAVCPGLDLLDNFLLTTRTRFSRHGLLDRKAALAELGGVLAANDVRPADPRVLARNLSGGNLQKLVLGREFFRAPRIIVAEQPTQGLDVAATEEVWRALLEARRTAGVLVVTGDIAEALELADRVAVMFGGRFMDVFPRHDKAKVAAIGQLMAGLPPGSQRQTTQGA